MVGPDRALVSIDMAGAQSLVGRVVGRGFRDAVDMCVAPGSLDSVLLSELPVAALLSGYGTLYSGLLPSPVSDDFVGGLPVDVCAGWAAPASLMVRIGRDRVFPTPDGPVAPPDDNGWHAMPVLAPGSMRRQRLLERTGEHVWAMFRDTYARADGVVTILHEYTVEATVSHEPGGARITRCVATPRVLPWAECPLAAASAAGLVGRPVAALRELVRHEFTGTSTCTHLNDLLSSLAQADDLVESPEQPDAR